MASPLYDTVHIKVEISERGDDFLDISYHVTNTFFDTVWLLNRLFDPADGDKPRIDPQKVYLHLDYPSILNVSKLMIPRPMAVQIDPPIVPAATRLPNSQSFSETLRLRFPLPEYQPYPFDQLKTAHLNKLQFIRFALGVVPDDPIIKWTQGQDANDQPFSVPNHDDLLPRQTILKTTLNLD